MKDKKSKWSPRFRRFVRMRRRWFLIVFIISLLPCGRWASAQSDTAIVILGTTLIGSAVLTTAISLLSAPVIWMLTRNTEDEDCEQNLGQVSSEPAPCAAPNEPSR